MPRVVSCPRGYAQLDAGRSSRLHAASARSCMPPWHMPRSVNCFDTHGQRQELLTFEREHGHCNVPQKYAHNPSLGAWVAQQRRRYKHGTLSGKRILMMEQIGIEWSLRRGAEIQRVRAGVRAEEKRKERAREEGLCGRGVVRCQMSVTCLRDSQVASCSLAAAAGRISYWRPCRAHRTVENAAALHTRLVRNQLWWRHSPTRHQGSSRRLAYAVGATAARCWLRAVIVALTS